MAAAAAVAGAVPASVMYQKPNDAGLVDRS